jgi:hypothetical protein
MYAGRYRAAEYRVRSNLNLTSLRKNLNMEVTNRVFNDVAAHVFGQNGDI